MSDRRFRRRGLFAALAVTAMILTLLPAAAGAEQTATFDVADPDDISVVTLVIPDQTTLTAVVQGGYDLDHDLEPVGNGYSVTGIVSNLQIAELEALGVDIELEATPTELAARHADLMQERAETLETRASSLAADTDTVVIARADWFTDQANRTLSVEAKTSDGVSPANQNPVMTLRWDAGPGTEIGDGGQINMGTNVDSGQYLYHRQAVNIQATLGDTMPTRVSVTSANGGYAEADVTEWLPTTFPPRNNRYFTGFLDHYPDMYEIDELMDDLVAEFPDLAELIELPYLTNGYRRPGMTVFGTANASRVGITSHAWGHEGGNDITVAFVNPGANDAPLSVSVAGNTITVNLATNAEGAIVSTAAQVVAAINAHAGASALVEAYTYRGNAGAGVVAAASRQLTDGLNAPDHVLRAPYQSRVLRIGKHRDGSKTGVFGFSAEHAREWNTPLVTVETAHRLLHNYRTDTETRRLVDNLDIFILPVMNPDGHLYSYYDFNSQRKNLTNYCGVGGNNDFDARNTWGVDLNRNYASFSHLEGYTGSSGACTSGNYHGPSLVSEPEVANNYWLAGAFPNIKYAMDIHSSGNYFMWTPGTYIAAGRIPPPRPTFGTENYFYDASTVILTAIKQHRGLSVTPARTGPIIDVLYAAAGSSADSLWEEFGMFGWAFEMGTSFQPSFAGGSGSEAWNQMMEYSNGLVGMFDVALSWTRDRYAPTSWINEDVSEPSDGPVGFTFGYSEAVDIYYTLDGSNPTTNSTRYEAAGIREGGETITVNATTTVKWFSVDMAGNVEGKYDPRRNNANTATIVITP